MIITLHFSILLFDKIGKKYSIEEQFYEEGYDFMASLLRKVSSSQCQLYHGFILFRKDNIICRLAFAVGPKKL